MIKMCEDLFNKLESILSGENRKSLDEIKKRFYQNIELWHADIEVLEQYYKDQDKENEELMIEISQSNDKIKQLREELPQSTGKVEDSNRLIQILERNNERLKKLRYKAKSIKEDKNWLKKSYAAQLGWAKRNYDIELSSTTRSYAAQLGWARRWHSGAVDRLERIYVESGNKKIRNINNLRMKIQNLCEEAIELCPTCSNPSSFCKCKTEDTT